MTKLFTLMVAGLISSAVWANPAKVANCLSVARDSNGLTGKQAATLCKKFKGSAVYTCYQQARQMGLDADLSVILCNEADTLSPLQCYRLSTTGGATPAEAATACSGDKP
jgi:hypothetical protein